MKKTFIFAFLIMLFMASCEGPQQPAGNDPADWVDPFIGTNYFAHLFPGPTVPFGMVQLSPDTDVKGWTYAAGYQWGDNSVMGFSHTHYSGVGMVAGGDILVMPTVGRRLQVVPGPRDDPDAGYRSRFSHDQEKASPGYYSVVLDDYGVKAELTATRRAGMHRYTFPASRDAHILIDLGHSIGRLQEGNSHIEIVDDHTLRGYKASYEATVYFVAQFSRSFDAYGTWDAAYRTPESGASLFPWKTAETGRQVGAFVNYHTAAGERILVKVGISYVSMAGAKKNLKAEIPGWDFDRVRQEAREMWNRELSKLAVRKAAQEQKTLFYTALYHAILAQRIFQDVDGSYRGMDNKTHTLEKGDFYPSFFCWDTYRSEHPLMTLVEPEHVDDMIRSLELKTRHYGWLPAQHHRNVFGQGMAGDHLVPIIVDAYRKGFRDWDSTFLFEAMYRKATEIPPAPLPPEDGRSGLQDYLQLGYVPVDRRPESVSNTLELSYDDWCIAQMAKELGKEDVYNEMMLRAKNYRNLFDKKSLFMRPRMADGAWLPACDGRPAGIAHNGDHTYYDCFDPLLVGRRPNRYFTESNAWQYVWSVQHDVAGLIDLFDGREAFLARLDTFFTMSPEISGPKYVGVVGTIGQYVHGNQPSHHVAYLYDFAGEPWKTQERVRQVLNLYRTGAGGICGNEDMGSLSSWYVLSAMGFYPVTPGSNRYMIGSPVIEEVVLKKNPPYQKEDLVIRAENVSEKNRYIQSVTCNGKILERPWITHEELTTGGKVVFMMGPEPNKNLWADGVKK
jgi:predicted alpha-1,2-mannosidase